MSTALARRKPTRGPRELARDWLDRAKHGDQRARAVLLDLGERVRAGRPKNDPEAAKRWDRLKAVYDAALSMRKERAAAAAASVDAPKRAWKWWPFGKKDEADFGGEAAAPQMTAGRKPLALLGAPADPEARKPPVPEGAYNGLLETASWASVCEKAAGYRYGLAGAALVLAEGPTIDGAWIEHAMQGLSTEDALDFWDATQKQSGKNPLAKCVAMARWIQRVKDPAAPPIGGVVGWELGE